MARLFQGAPHPHPHLQRPHPLGLSLMRIPQQSSFQTKRVSTKRSFRRLQRSSHPATHCFSAAHYRKPSFQEAEDSLELLDWQGGHFWGPLNSIRNKLTTQSKIMVNHGCFLWMSHPVNSQTHLFFVVMIG